MSRTYKAVKLIPDESVFARFLVGFNSSHSLSDYVDAGNRKEAADSKLKGTPTLKLI